MIKQRRNLKRRAWKFLGWLLLRPFPAATLAGGLSLALALLFGWAHGWDLFWVFIAPFAVILASRLWDNGSGGG